MSRPEHPSGRTTPQPYAWGSGATETQKKSLAPNRKPLAALGGGGIAGSIAVVIAYQFPGMPPTVAVAWATILVLLSSFVVSYFVPAGEGE